MSKKHQTLKYRKQRKKELANRKAKQEQAHKLEEHMFPKKDEPISPARRAFQNK